MNRVSFLKPLFGNPISALYCCDQVAGGVAKCAVAITPGLLDRLLDDLGVTCGCDHVGLGTVLVLEGSGARTSQ